VDPELRHSAHTRAELEGSGATSLLVYDALEAVVGASTSFLAPDLPPEPASVAAELDTVGPDTELDWHPPPWAPDRGGAPSENSGGP
jgi:hypothetical protein